MSTAPDFNINQLVDELNQLSQFSSAKVGVTRVLYSKEDMAARAFFKNLCREADLSVREDAIGNIFARWHGSDPDLPAIGAGSHIDAIPESGMYDGTIGVLGGLEALRGLKRSGFKPKRSLEVLMFTAEEPTRFGIGCLGSRMLSGNLIPEKAVKLADTDNRTFQEVRKDAGYHDPNLEAVLLRNDYYGAFIELHIEQGPKLEQTQKDIGVVTKIAAPSTLRVKIQGKGGHAGAVLMPDRRDACTAAAEIALAVERIALNSQSNDTVGTTGIFKIHPGAVNSIPSSAHLEIDLRDTQLEVRDHCLGKIEEMIGNVSDKRGVQSHMELINSDPPASCAENVVQAIEKSAKELGYSYHKMISRAYHDSLFMALKFPAGMIFIPCREGISHRPDEYASPEQIEKGVAVLAQTLKRLSEE